MVTRSSPRDGLDLLALYMELPPNPSDRLRCQQPHSAVVRDARTNEGILDQAGWGSELHANHPENEGKFPRRFTTEGAQRSVITRT
jgi:hypothetical protein